MSYLQKAPVQVIGLAYILTTIPVIASAMYITQGSINGFNSASVTPIVFLIAFAIKFAALIPLLLFIPYLLVSLLLRARKINSLIFYYIVSIILGFVSIFGHLVGYVFTVPIYEAVDGFVSSYSRPPLFYVIENLQSGIFPVIINLIFWSVMLYLLIKAKANTPKEPEQKSVSITEVLKSNG